MPQHMIIRQRGPNGRFLSNHARATATKAQPSAGLAALPPEIRLTIYGFLFGSTDRRTLRYVTSQRDAAASRGIKLFNTSILTTCKTIYSEAFPVFYASQIFHYAASLDGLCRQPVILTAYLGWMKHVSIEVAVTTRSYPKLDAIVTTHVQTITQLCTKLDSLTLHVIPASEADTLPFYSSTQTDLSFYEGAAAKALRMLRPRISRLSIAYFGGWDTLHHLRKTIARDERWVEEGKCYKWPGLRLTEAQSAAVSFPQRRYALIGHEDINHPHRQCIRVFHTFRSKIEEGVLR